MGRTLTHAGLYFDIISGLYIDIIFGISSDTTSHNATGPDWLIELDLEPLGLYRSKTRQGPALHAVCRCFVQKPKSCRTDGPAYPLCGALSLGALSFRCFVPACSAHPDGRCLHLDKAPGTKHPMHIILIFGRNDEPDLMARITSCSGARLGANARLGWREHYPSGTNIPQMQDVSIAHSAAHGQPRIGSLPTWPPLPPLRFGSSSLSRADWVSPFGSPTP